MALDTAPKIRAKRLIAGKLETTTGTAIALSAADGVDYVFDPSLDYQTDTIEIPPQAGFISPRGRRIAARRGTCTFSTEFRGDGNGAPDWFKYLHACGMTGTATLTPVSGATETVTIGLNQDGRLKQLAGCMGTWEAPLMAGRPGMIKFDMQGVQAPVADAAIWAPTFNTTVTPLVSAAAITIGSATYVLDGLTIAANNIVTLRKDTKAVDSAGNPTGYRAAYITGRRYSVRVSPESLPLATKDWYTVFHAGTELALSVVIGNTGGNTFTITAPKMVLANAPREGEREGVMVDDLEFTCLMDSGDDEISIAAT